MVLEQPMQLLFNLLSHTIRTGELESGMSTDSKHLEGMTVREIFELFKSLFNIKHFNYKFKDLLIFSNLEIQKNKLINIYIVSVGDIDITTIKYDSSNNMIIPNDLLKYLEYEIVISTLDITWLEG